jgi:hypothetical protein
VGRWDLGTANNIRLINVLTWEFSIPTINGLVRVELDAQGTPHQSVLSLPSITNDTLELFIRHIPVTELDGTSSAQLTPGVTRGTHLHAFYDLLGFPKAGRDIPVYKADEETCDYEKFFFSPGAPTCLVAAGLPPE